MSTFIGFTLIFVAFALSVYAGVDKTTSIPIRSIEELQKIGNDNAYPLDGDYVMANDIDASATATWNPDGTGGYYGFGPIGRHVGFTGTFDGGGHTISNLYIRWPGNQNGLFGLLETAGVVENLKTSGEYVEGALHTGGIVGLLRGTIRRCEVLEVAVHGYFVGGIAGIGADGSAIEDCKATGFVGNRGNNVLSGGGLAGHAASVENCMASCEIDGEGIESHPSGGLVGGLHPSVIVNSYYDADVAGVPDMGKGAPKTTAEMKQQATFDGWDFKAIWTIDEGNDYPALQAVDLAHTVTFDLNG